MQYSESDRSDASTPEIRNVDTIFVAKHNRSADLYQKIIEITSELLVALEDEKNYLMCDVLYAWAVKQQKISIGTLWAQQVHYNLLDTIDKFEYFGELLEQTLSGLSYLMKKCPNDGFDIFYAKLQETALYFLYYSIIVSRQPPSVVIKCGEAENHRRSRFWFNTEIRVLGGRAFKVDENGKGVQVECFLITDDTARQLLADAYHRIFENEEFSIEPQLASFNLLEMNGLLAKFEDMRVSKKDHLRRDSVATKRYCLCYNIQLNASHGIELIGKKVSLPFAILVGPKSEVEARLFLERSFANLVRQPLSDVPKFVSCQEMVDALDMKISVLQDKKHLLIRLNPDRDGEINLENFTKLAVCQEYSIKKVSNEGEWKLLPFSEWFFKTAEIINKYLYQLWFEGLVYGFCGKDEAEELLRSLPYSCLLIRFSDVEYGKIKVSVRYRNGVIQHHWYNHADLSARPLQKELLTNHKFSEVDYIYPNINLKTALGDRQKPNDFQKPRILNPTPFYFDNQGAATSSF
ncbi:unnamed protein product [Dracunculus medinensis]|uniref:SH2 domain-containing protein n=1 Tax=Dracunculus medinensis TaxID=318479 RepID=A0A0N4UJ56_DRAME|nr:unnamed protein product [Dracunculus medinensis]